MLVYTEKAIYDDPWSYCDDRYKIAGQWYGTSKFAILFLFRFLSSFVKYESQDTDMNDRNPQNHGVLENAGNRNRFVD